MMEFSRLKNRVTARAEPLQSKAARGPGSAPLSANCNPASSRQAIAGAARDRLGI